MCNQTMEGCLSEHLFLSMGLPPRGMPPTQPISGPENSAGVRVVVSSGPGQPPGQLPGGYVGVSGTAVLQRTKRSV